MTNGTGSLNATDCPVVKIPDQVFFAIAAVSLGENLLVVVAVVCNRRLHSPMYCFICSLAAFNTLSSLSKTWETVMLLFCSAGMLDASSNPARRLDDVMDTLLVMSFLGSLFSFLAIAADRYITIFHALRYHSLVTLRRAAAVLTAIWALCGGGGALMVVFFDWAAVMTGFIALFLAALLLILLFYVHIFLLARQHARCIAALPGRPQGRGRRGGGMRGAMTLTVLLGVFVACWAPFFLHLLLLTVCPQNPYCECYRSLFHLHLVLLMSHALIDPAIYAYRSAELRSTFRKMLFCSDSNASLCHRCV